MTIFYSPTASGFYDDAIHLLAQIPGDAKEIAAEQHTTLLQAQSQGKQIVADNDGFPVALDPPPLTIEQEKRIYSDAIQHHLDAAALAHGYDDIKTAVSYADEPAVQKFQNDGKAFRTWRSLVWAYAYQQLDLVEHGKREKPSIEQLIAELPALIGI